MAIGNGDTVRDYLHVEDVVAAYILLLEQGLSGMKVGGRRLLVTPPKVAWGDQGDGSGIGPNETLVWVVDLAAVTN